MKFLTCAGSKVAAFHATAFLSQVACAIALFFSINQYTPERGVLAHPQTSWDRAVCESPILSLLRPFRFHLSEEFEGQDKPYYACPWPEVNFLLRVIVTVTQLLASHALMVVSLKKQFQSLWFLWWLCKYASLICAIGGAASVSIDINQLILGTKLCAAQFKSGGVQLIVLPGYDKGFEPQCDQGTYVYTAIATGFMALFGVLVVLGAETLPRTMKRGAEEAEFRKQLTMPLNVSPLHTMSHVYHPPTIATVSTINPYTGQVGSVMPVSIAQIRTNGTVTGRNAVLAQHPNSGGVAIMDRSDVESQATVQPLVSRGGPSDQVRGDSEYGAEERE